ncbi:MAG: hypothetical protein IJV10_01170 [Prevotella sp.]|nr:hypothetical protein [Prevotella sp.]
MKKYLFSFLTLMVTSALCVCLTSCGDDDDERAKSSPLTGMWVPSYAIGDDGSKIEYNFPYYTVTLYEDGQWHTKTLSYLDKDNEGSVFFKYYLNGDGTGYWRNFRYDHGKYEENEIETIPIVYVLDGDKFTITINSEYIDFLRKNSDDMTESDFEKMENYIHVLTYDSANNTLAESIDGGTFYYSKK